jgi:hypothetical protein
MFIKLKQKIKKYWTKTLSKKFSGFGIFKFPNRKVLLGVFLMVMIFGGVFGGGGEVRAEDFYEGLQSCYGSQAECQQAVENHCNRFSDEPIPNPIPFSLPLPSLRAQCKISIKCDTNGCLRGATITEAITETPGATIGSTLNTIGGAIAEVLKYLANIILAIVYAICWLLLHLAGIFVDLSANFLHSTLDPALYKDMLGSNSTIVAEGWKIVRDVCNMFFILILLIISLATILRIQAYKAQSLLLPLLIAAFLVNFSRPIVELAIDASQILMYQFVNLMGGSFIDSNVNKELTKMTDLFIDSFGGWDKVGAIVMGSLMNAVSWVIAIMFALVFVIVLALVYSAMALFMIIRLVALTILIILSPIGFFFNILPQTKSYASKYWAELSKYIIFGPIMAFFIYLAGFLAITVPEGLKDNLREIATADKFIVGGGTETLVLLLERLLPYVIIMVFLYASVWIARQMGIWGADKIQAMTFGKAAAVGGFLGGAVGGYMGRSLAKGKLPWQDTVRSVITKTPGIRAIGKPLDKLVQSAAKKKITTKSGKEISVGRIKEQALGLLSPGAIKRGYQAHIADEEAEAYGVSTGRMQDLIERTYVMGCKKPTHERMGQLNQIAEEQKKVVSTNPDEITDIFLKAKETGTEEMLPLMEAMVRKLGATGDALTILAHEDEDQNPDELREYLVNLFKDRIGEENTAKLLYDIGYTEDKAGIPANRGSGAYKDKKWQVATPDEHFNEAMKSFWKKEPRARWTNVAGDQFFTTLAHPIKMKDSKGNKIEIKKVLNRYGVASIENSTSTDLKELNRTSTTILRDLKEYDELAKDSLVFAELKKRDQNTEEISKIKNKTGESSGDAFIKKIDDVLKVQPQGKGKGTQTTLPT